ncbi:MAG: DNA polymerase III subunit alpha [Mycoplasmataceae bacterium]|nr:DNA polymerase III subunit alpha [Mycoplasmataceae bacterium]
MTFAPLHLNTEYSFHESTIQIDDLIVEAKKNNIKRLVITDHNNMFGVSEFISKTKFANIIPIIGLDLDVEDFRIILLAKNHEGYVHLNKLSSKKMRGNEIKLEEIDSRNLFIIDHPQNGYVKTRGESPKIANFFINSMIETTDNSVYAPETKFIFEEDREAINLLSKINNIEIDVSSIDPLNFNPSVNGAHIDQAYKILLECNIVWELVATPLPKFKIKKELTSIALLKDIINKNIALKLEHVVNRDIYIKRIRYEISIIEKLGFEDYFLIIWDLIKWAKNNDIGIGPGRGSSSGSLVSYILDITEVDPIEYGLLFERFLNPERVSMPDIDIDIQDDRRNELVKYLFDKYGSDNTALISTFSRLGAKSAIRDVARFMNIPMHDVNLISKNIPTGLTLEEAYKNISRFRALIDSSILFTKLFKNSKLVEGLPRQFSTHAAGIVLSKKKIFESSATVEGPGGFNQLQFPMNYLEEHGLLKIDLLGLRNITIIKRIQFEIKKNRNIDVNLRKINLNNKATNKLLSSGDTNGIFQLESYGMKDTLKKVGVDSLTDVVAILSLYRPGPMDNIPLYSDIKNGKKLKPNIEESYDEITNETHGIIVYQEQIMQIAQRFSGMSFGESDILRRAIGKKKISLIKLLKEKFIQGASEKGHSKEMSINIYSIIEKFASYGFNKSHAVAYSLISYWMAFLKACYKIEFYVALLDASTSSQSTIKKYFDEARLNTIIVKSPSISLSQENVVIIKGQIQLPLSMIKGIGETVSKKILEIREEKPFKSLHDFVSRSLLLGIGESTIQLLINSNSLKEFGNMQTLSDSLPSSMRYANLITIKKDGIKILDHSIIGNPKLIIQDRIISDEIFNEKKTLGFQANAFITLPYEGKYRLIDIPINGSQEIVVNIEKIRKFSAKDGRNIGKFTLSDSSVSIEAMAFQDVFKFIDDSKHGMIVKAIIEKKSRNNSYQYIIKRKWKIVSNG